VSTKPAAAQYDADGCGFSSMLKRVEFYYTEDMEDQSLPNLLEEWQFFYNWHRPHSTLNGKHQWHAAVNSWKPPQAKRKLKAGISSSRNELGYVILEPING
jgi:hypothetical protein